MGYPFVVTAPRWTEGEHVLRLREFAFDGRSQDESFLVILDTTPPNLTRTSAVPAAAGRLLLSAEAPGAVNVTAKFLGRGNPVLLTLRPRGNGRFESEAVPPAEWSSIVFSASDEAGNEQSVRVEAPARATPVPPLLALGALSGSALGLSAFRKKRSARPLDPRIAQACAGAEVPQEGEARSPHG
jgi:hypothetical protein